MIHDAKDLLHDGVLAQIVATLRYIWYATSTK